MGRSRRSGKILQLKRTIRSLKESPPVNLPAHYYDELLTEFDRLTSTPNKTSKSDIEITYVKLRRRKRPSIIKIETPRPLLKIKLIRRNPPSSAQEPPPISFPSTPAETLCYSSYPPLSPPSSPYCCPSYSPIPSPELDALSSNYPSYYPVSPPPCSPSSQILPPDPDPLSTRPSSPAESTSSVEFIGEFPSSLPRHR